MYVRKLSSFSLRSHILYFKTDAFPHYIREARFVEMRESVGEHSQSEEFLINMRSLIATWIRRIGNRAEFMYVKQEVEWESNILRVASIVEAETESSWCVRSRIYVSAADWILSVSSFDRSDVSQFLTLVNMRTGLDFIPSHYTRFRRSYSARRNKTFRRRTCCSAKEYEKANGSGRTRSGSMGKV